MYLQHFQNDNLFKVAKEGRKKAMWLNGCGLHITLLAIILVMTNKLFT